MPPYQARWKNVPNPAISRRGLLEGFAGFLPGKPSIGVQGGHVDGEHPLLGISGVVFRLWVQFAGSAPLGMPGPAFDARIGEVAHFGQQKAQPDLVDGRAVAFRIIDDQ